MLKDLLHTTLLVIAAYTVSFLMWLLILGGITMEEIDWVHYAYMLGLITICPPYFIYALFMLSLNRFVKWVRVLGLFISSTLVIASVMGYFLIAQDEEEYGFYLIFFAVLSVGLLVKILRSKPHLDT